MDTTHCYLQDSIGEVPDADTYKYHYNAEKRFLNEKPYIDPDVNNKRLYEDLSALWNAKGSRQGNTTSVQQRIYSAENTKVQYCFLLNGDKLIRNIMLAFAEFERDMIVERTQEGKAIAKLNPDFREGRPKKFSKAQINHALSLLNDYSYTQVAQMTGVSKSTLIRARKQIQ